MPSLGWKRTGQRTGLTWYDFFGLWIFVCKTLFVDFESFFQIVAGQSHLQHSEYLNELIFLVTPGKNFKLTKNEFHFELLKWKMMSEKISLKSGYV